ncbi:hypothetical protein P43SY_000437 [Pythium insidiosum]|uniref:CKK domain-containing protein n=1 Tax=Pythium insidiosum TaxID=114742 RepID=A0AAD5Q5Y5_PYTIN|nr:hypothetical protein P43SY_000437 [Pythium insidiosum]
MTATSSAVAACLGVASALLRPEATPSSVCSKAALQTIVLEAHRLAQQTALPASTTASADVRGLLRLLAGDVAPSLQLVETEPIAGELGQGIGALETRLRRVGEHAHALGPSDHQHDDDDDVLMATMPTVRRASDSVNTFGGVPIRAPVPTATAAAVAQPPHTSEPELESFVVLEQPSTRHERLAELRQRKLQQLQKARDEALKKKVTTRVPVATAVPAPHQTAPAHTASAVLPQTRGPARPSNRQLIQNAIEFTLLAGASLERARTAALQAVAASTCDNFVVLLKSAKELKFRALYEHRPGSSGEEASATFVRIYALSGSAPPVLIEDTIGQFFRYNSGKKEFTPIDARSFTVRTDACALRDALVFTKKTTSAWSKAIL